MSEKKPMPVAVGPIPKKCPVYGKSSYSLGGIHPQCAVSQADAPRRLQIAADKKAKTLQETHRAWEKTCPKCDARAPIRRSVCECGFDFTHRRQ